MRPRVALRPLEPARDRGTVERLWAQAFPPAWPPLPLGLRMLREGYVAEAGADVVGMVAVDRRGSIPLVMVSPDHRRRGLGTRLVGAALETLAGAGCGKVALGSGGSAYIWPGVPGDLPEAVAFFENAGWRWIHTVTDLVRDLRGYTTPGQVWERVGPLGLSLELVGHEPSVAVLAFEDQHFPNWARYFRKGRDTILVAVRPEAGIAGSLLLHGPDPAVMMAPLLGAGMGTIGCVGVAEAHQGAGIGTALVARASEVLRDRGVDTCLVDWTLRTRFYGRLGYLPWREYLMAARDLREHPI